MTITRTLKNRPFPWHAAWHWPSRLPPTPSSSRARPSGRGARSRGSTPAQGKDISPPLAWSDMPAGTRSLALICDDPDAPIGTWVHWVYYNIPVTVTSLPEAMPKTERPAPGGIHGKSSFRDFGYGGPCPPWGTHRYYFRLYALDTSLNLESGATKKDVLKAIQGHILGTAELMGTYRKK